MKIIILLTINLLIAINALSQIDWAPIGAEWHYIYREGILPNYGTYFMKSIKDTLIQNKKCSVIKQWSISSAKHENYNYVTQYIYNNVAENRVYRYMNGSFCLLYDFNKNVGDTIKIITKIDNNRTLDSLMLVVDSVGTYLSQSGKVLKVQVIREALGTGNEFNFAGEVIETLGNIKFFFPISQLACDSECPNELLCYNDSVISYKNSRYDSCEYYRVYNVLFNNNMDREVSIYPNPCSNELFFKNKSNSTACFEIYDLKGVVVIKKSNVSNITKIDISKIDSGVHFMRIFIGDNIIVRKIIKL